MNISRLSINSFWLLLSRLGTQAGMALFTILLARGLGSALFGEYAFMASVVVIGNVLTTFGTDMHLIREIAAHDDVTELIPSLIIQLALSCLFIAAVMLGSTFLPEQGEAGLGLRIYSFSMLPLAFFTVATTALRGRQRMPAYASLNLASIAMQVGVALWLVTHRGGLIELAQLLLGVQVCAAMLAGLLCRTEIRELIRTRSAGPHSVLPLLRVSAPIALLGALGVVYQRLNILLLPALAGAAATGWFSAAARVMEAAKIGHIAGFTALYPSMALARARNVPVWMREFRLPGLVLLAGALLGALALWLFAGSLVRLLFGPQYSASIPLVRILAWILVPYTINSFLTLALLAKHQESLVAAALGVSLMALVLLTLWWVPALGAVGAAWAALAAELGQSIVLLASDFSSGRLLLSMRAADRVV